MESNMIETARRNLNDGIALGTETREAWIKKVARVNRDLAVAVTSEDEVAAVEKASERKLSTAELAMGRIFSAGYRAMDAQFKHEVSKGHIKPGDDYGASDVSSLLDFLQSRKVSSGDRKGEPIAMTGIALPGITVKGQPVNLSFRCDGLQPSRLQTPEQKAKAKAKAIEEARKLLAEVDGK